MDIYQSSSPEIVNLRKGMWTAIQSRLHTPIKVFPFGADSTELMLYGTVAYGYKDGRKAEVCYISWPVE